MSFEFRCGCGAIQGSAKPESFEPPVHVVCYCKSCRIYAQKMGRGGYLDPFGGSSILQMSPAAIEFHEGKDKLACLRLSEKGPLRLYAACCNTLIANIASSSAIPFLGLVTDCIAEKTDIPEPDYRIHGKNIERSASAQNIEINQGEINQGMPFALLAGTLWSILRRRFRGDHRANPFFDPQTGKPIASPDRGPL